MNVYGCIFSFLFIKWIDSGVSSGGLVLGMTQTLVNPPAIAANDPVFRVSLSSLPGSRKCTCKSQNPWVITFPVQSMISQDSGFSNLPISCILPSLMRTSALYVFHYVDQLMSTF
ncbi:MAG: hypothetical protein CM15mP87_02460 [Candidatus Neomarinimicrobiota bacterium]|nr:MAG: hypothetical protein CM15mP87_02460 [Candidatus Neomarinimicrobiota bacterium]